MFGKPHDRAILAMYAHNWLESAVHGDTTNFANGSKRKHVSDRIGVEPYVPKITKETFHFRILEAAVRLYAEDMVAGANVR